jgi:thiamine biosynthesis lipoprotein
VSFATRKSIALVTAVTKVKTAARVYCGVLFIACGLSASAHAEWYSEKRPIMGTVVSVELWADDATVAKEAIEAVMQEMVHVDQTMSPFIETSELSLINREAVAHPVKISAEMLLLLKTALSL